MIQTLLLGQSVQVFFDWVLESNDRSTAQIPTKLPLIKQVKFIDIERYHQRSTYTPGVRRARLMWLWSKRSTSKVALIHQRLTFQFSLSRRRGAVSLVSSSARELLFRRTCEMGWSLVMILKYSSVQYPSWLNSRSIESVNVSWIKLWIMTE